MKIKAICLSCISGLLIAGVLAFQPAVTSTGNRIKPSATPKSRRTKTKPTTSAVQPSPPKRFKAEIPEELENEAAIRTRDGNQVNLGSAEGATPRLAPARSVTRPPSNILIPPTNTNSNVGFIGSPADGQGIRRRQANSSQQLTTNGAGGTLPPVNSNTATTTGNNRQSAVGSIPSDGTAPTGSPRANAGAGANRSAAPIRQKRRPKTKQ